MHNKLDYLGKVKDLKLELSNKRIIVGWNYGYLNFILLKNNELLVYDSSYFYKVRFLSVISNIKNNMIKNIRNLQVGYYREVILEGLGYMFMVYSKERELRFEGGYSHGIYLKYSKGVVLAVEKKRLLIYSILKKEVSDIHKMIRKLKKVDVYKGKGVRDKDEVILLKVGKKR